LRADDRARTPILFAPRPCRSGRRRETAHCIPRSGGTICGRIVREYRHDTDVDAAARSLVHERADREHCIVEVRREGN
jgi:hypothetical protein